MNSLPRHADVRLGLQDPRALLAEPETEAGSYLARRLAAPGYAPPGRHLVATTAPAEAEPSEAAIRGHLAVLYGQPTGNWEHLQTVRAEPGLVAAPPPQGNLRKPVRLTGTLFIAGDHRDTPSLQGALVSGRRAARAVLGELGVRGRYEAVIR